MTREPTLKLPNPWAAVGRDTEAGRALFALYNGYGHARSRGNDYSQINKFKTLRHIATHGVPEFPAVQPPPPKKPEVKVPHFSHSRYNPEDFHPIDFIPRRRRGSEILQQIRDDSYEIEYPPMPKGPLLDDAEKARLQEVFYWSNRNLGPEPVAEPPRRVPNKGSIEEQELMLNTIAGEIEDRDAFLNEMEAYGKGEQYRGQIMFQIQQRVGQMKLLHENITLQEKKENENHQSTKATPPPGSSYTVPPTNLHARGQGRNANTTSLRFNPFIATIPELDEDPRFWKIASNSTRPSEAPDLSSAHRYRTLTSNPYRTDTPDSFTPNVIRTAACYPATPSDASATSAAEPQPSRKMTLNLNLNSRSNSNSNLNLNLNLPPNSRRHSTEGAGAGNSVGSSNCSVTASSPFSSSNSGPRFRSPSFVHPQKGGRSKYTSGMTSENYPSGSTPWNGGCSPAGECSPAGSAYDFIDDRDEEY